jgi:hypothetical protein
MIPRVSYYFVTLGRAITQDMRIGAPQGTGYFIFSPSEEGNKNPYQKIYDLYMKHKDDGHRLNKRPQTIQKGSVF